MSDKTTPFSRYLSELVKPRGEVARLAKEAKVSGPFISRIAQGDVLPSVEVLSRLLKALPLETDRDHLALEYVKLHLPEGTQNIRIHLRGDAVGQGRLEHLVEGLDPKTREALTRILETISRVPEQGRRALQGLAFIFNPDLSDEAENNAGGFNSDSLNKNPECPSDLSPPAAAPATPGKTVPGRGSPPSKAANIVELPIAHWQSGEGPGKSGASRVAEDGSGK